MLQFRTLFVNINRNVIEKHCWIRYSRSKNYMDPKNMMFQFRSVRGKICVSLLNLLRNLGILFGFFYVGLISSHSRFFHSYGDVTITGEGLQIFTYARHSWS